MTHTTQLYTWIREETTLVSNERGTSLSRAFAAWCLRLANNLDLDDAFDQTSAVEAQTNHGIDGWYREEDSSELQIWSCTWTDDPTQVFDATAGEKALKTIDKILAGSGPKVGAAYNFPSKALRSAAEHDYEIVVYVAAPTRLSPDASEKLGAHAIEIGKKRRVQLSLQIADAQALDDLNYEQHSIEESLSGEQVTFSVADAKVMELNPPTIPKNWKAALANLAGGSLAQIAATHGMRLFHMNVRYALPRKQKQIQNIRRTLSDAGEAQRFWLYNNGLTILCDDFKVSKKSDSIEIENPQIVNGCQTVTAFKESADKFVKSASVLARIICPASAETTNQAALISERTNSQTPVLARDLKTNDRVQQQLKIAMDRLTPRWFYEVKRGEWTALGSKSPYQNGGKRLVDIVQLGQSYRMLYEPAEAITKKRLLFEDQDTYDTIFTKERTPEEYLFAELLRRHFANFWRKDNLPHIRAVCGEIIDETLLNRLMRAKNQVVAHCVALTGMLFDWSHEWSTDAVQDSFATITNKKFTLAPWLRHIGLGLVGIVQLIDAVTEAKEKEAKAKDTNSSEEPMNIKKHFERGEQRTLWELWKKISGNALLLLGPGWRTQLLKQVVQQ